MIKAIADVLSDGFNRLFANVKRTMPPLASSAITEEPCAVFDPHVRAEFAEQSVDATMATMTDAPYVTHVPVMIGGYGYDVSGLAARSPDLLGPRRENLSGLPKSC